MKSFFVMKHNIWIQSGDCIHMFCFIWTKDVIGSFFFWWRKIFDYNLVVLFKYFNPLKGKISCGICRFNEAKYLNTTWSFYLYICFIGRKDFSSVFSEWRKLFEYNLAISFKNLIHSTERLQFSFLRMKENIWIQSSHSIQIFRFIRRKDFSSVFFEWS